MRVSLVTRSPPSGHCGYAVGQSFVLEKLGVVAIVASGLLVVGCSTGTTAGVVDGEPTSQSEVGDTASGGGGGAQEIPLPLGTTVILDDGSGGVWEVTLGTPTLNANTVIREENPYNEPPPRGLQYATLPVAVKFLGDDGGTPSFDLDISFVSRAGTTHKGFDVPVVGPTPLSSVGELARDALGEGTLTIAIPTLDVDLGTWRVSSAGVDNPVFFTAQ